MLKSADTSTPMQVSDMTTRQHYWTSVGGWTPYSWQEIGSDGGLSADQVLCVGTLNLLPNLICQATEHLLPRVVLNLCQAPQQIC